MKKTLLFILNLLIIIKGEKWYGEITGYDINDSTKYAGKKGIIITHFYLCGNREYWVHFKGQSNWSYHTFRACEPAGNGSPIDGICIGGGLKYRVRLKTGEWLDEVVRCNICENSPTAFAGRFGQEISSIAISGGDKYSVAEGENSSNYEECAKRVFYNLFKYNVGFDKEREILKFLAGTNIVTLQLIQRFEFNQKGADITFTIKNGEIESANWNKKIFNNEINVDLKKIINNDPIDFKMGFEYAFKSGMNNGKVSITYDFIRQVFTIEAISKINANRLIYSGGFRINIFLNNGFKSKFMPASLRFPQLLPREYRLQVLKNPKNSQIITFDNIFNQENLLKMGRIAFEIGITIALVVIFNQILPALPLILIERFVQ